MLLKAFGIIDIIAGLILILRASLSSKVFLILGIILLAKASLGLLKDFASWVDFISGGIFILLTVVSIPSIIGIIVGILIIQKGLFSFL
ncbi:MAG TPA: hypothetical protein ENH46_03020 [Candidatus Pacearchaeota archaeon]|nr:hypothetical protein [Candidatus Pacearchaeota archaeon]